MFDSKKYDIDAFDFKNKGRYKIIYYDTKLDENSVELARGKDAVCCFVNDSVTKEVIDKLNIKNGKRFSANDSDDVILDFINNN